MSQVTIPGFDPNVWRKRGEELAARTGGDSDFVYASKIFKTNNNVICFRIVVDPRFGLDGNYWLDKFTFKLPTVEHAILNPKTVGLPDPFLPVWEVAKARAKQDPNMKALVERKDGKFPAVGDGLTAIIPVMLCHTTSVPGKADIGDPIDGTVKFLECNVTMGAAINNLVGLAPNMINGMPIALNPMSGQSIYVQKTGTDAQSKFTCQLVGAHKPLPQEGLAEVPNLKDLLTKWCKPYDHLQSLINNYFYNMPIVPIGKDDAPVTGPIAGAAAQPVTYQQTPQPVNQPIQQPVQQYTQPQQQFAPPVQQGTMGQTPVNPPIQQPVQQPMQQNPAMGGTFTQPEAPRNVMDDLSNFTGQR